MNITWTPEIRFTTALLLGLLIGLERESSSYRQQKVVIGGVRTYSLVSLLGFGCGWLHQLGVALAVPVGLAAVTAMALLGYQVKQRQGRIGYTNEASILLTFVMGALALLADIWIAMALGILSALLLSEKTKLEAYAQQIERTEFKALARFLLVTLIIYPALPDQEFTRFQFNPYRIWKIVVLVSSIGFGGYMLAKRFGARAGLWLSGLLGGIVSSTAVSIAMGREARQQPERAGAALQATVLACSVMYLRILVLIAVFNQPFADALWWRLVALAGMGMLIAVVHPRTGAAADSSYETRLQNPFELRPALIFAALFSGLTVLTTQFQGLLGGVGVILLAAVVGVVDVDPFILSLVRIRQPPTAVLCTAVLVALLSNTIAKGIYFAAQARPVRKATALAFSAWAAAHILLLWGL